MEELKIVEAGPNDADLVAVMAYALLTELYAGNPPLSDEEVYQTCQDLFAGDSRFLALLGFGAGQKPLAVMTMVEVAALSSSGRFGIIMEFFVDPAFRSRGVGEKMLDQARELGQERGWSCLELTARDGPEVHRAVNFYMRRGFQDVGPMLRLDLKL